MFGKAVRILSTDKILGKGDQLVIIYLCFQGALETQVTVGWQNKPRHVLIKRKPDNWEGVGHGGLIRLPGLEPF